MPPLILRADDHGVINARKAGQALFDYYGLHAQEHFVTLPHWQLKIRILEIGTGEPLVIVPGNTGRSFTLAGKA